MKIKRICPNCCIELIFEHKELGGLIKNWFVCINCGYREKAHRGEKGDTFDKFREISNNHGGEHKQME